MKLWASLYLLVWLAFLEIILVLVPDPGLGFMTELHIILGGAIIFLAFFNAGNLSGTSAPDRVKRVSKVTAGFAVAQGILGLLIYFSIGTGIMEFLHLVASLAVIAQASSVATGYDMWEEREFERTPASA
ncbi:MAG: hypothetical protein ACE5IJ_00770 [Thermoplasmata archaeon]